MNKRNDWKSALTLTNSDLHSDDCEIILSENESGFYHINIRHGEDIEEFADNIFEDELTDTIIMARSRAIEKLREGNIFILSYIGLSDSDPDGNGYNEVKAFRNYQDARERMQLYIKSELEQIEEMGYEPNVLEDEEDFYHVTWAQDTEQVIIRIQEVELH